MTENDFTVIDNQTLVDRVEAQLVDLLHQRKLKVGDTIPKELDLASALGVSRTVIREALLRLRLVGLIDSKKKKGAVITSPDIFSTLTKSLNPHILDDSTLREVFEIRLVLEVGMADLLFRYVTKEDIEELKNIVKNEPADSKNQMFNADYEISFHGKLYEITGNETLKKFQKLLLPVFDYVQQSAILKIPDKRKKFVSHRQLVSLLETGTPDKFREGMRRHLENHFSRIMSGPAK